MNVNSHLFQSVRGRRGSLVNFLKGNIAYSSFILYVLDSFNVVKKYFWAAWTLFMSTILQKKLEKIGYYL